MNNKITVIGKRILTALSDTAKSVPRLRKNYNIHPGLEDPVQRLYNAMEPGTYVRPHRHQGAGRWEFFQIVSGSAAAMTFDAHGTVLEKVQLSARGPDYAVEIPADTWHTIVSLEHETVLFEVKQGPYQAVTDKDFAPWAPAEGEPGVTAFIQWLKHANPGDVPNIA